MSERSKTDRFQLARFVLRLTFVIVTGVGFAISALLVALAFALERLYPVQALPWAFATLALPACGLVVLALSTRLARFVARTSDDRTFSETATDTSGEPNKPLQATRAAPPNGQRARPARLNGGIRRLGVPEKGSVRVARVNYDEVTSNYDRRFAVPGREQVGAALLALASDVRARCALEVGCGTGHWLSILQDTVPLTYGVDRSIGMLRKARERRRSFVGAC